MRTLIFLLLLTAVGWCDNKMPSHMTTAPNAKTTVLHMSAPW